jgi:hypothetical protein
MFQKHLRNLFILIVYLTYGFYIYRPGVQVVDIMNADPIELLSVSHPHAWRLIVSYPGLIFNNYLNAEFGFGIYTALIGFIAYSLWNNIGKFVQYPPSNFSLLIFLITCAVMNGRGVFAWFSWLLCVSICLNKDRIPVLLFVLLMLISLFYSTVSSGVFFVVFATFLINFILFAFNSKKTSKVTHKILLSFFGLTALISQGYGYLSISVAKNFDFYEVDNLDFDSLLVMATHGILSLSYSILLVVTVVISTFFIWGWKIKNTKRFKDLFSFLISAAMGGIFGFTTLTLLLPVLLLIYALPVKVRVKDDREIKIF